MAAVPADGSVPAPATRPSVPVAADPSDGEDAESAARSAETMSILAEAAAASAAARAALGRPVVAPGATAPGPPARPVAPAPARSSGAPAGSVEDPAGPSATAPVESTVDVPAPPEDATVVLPRIVEPAAPTPRRSRRPVLLLAGLLLLVVAVVAGTVALLSGGDRPPASVAATAPSAGSPTPGAAVPQPSTGDSASPSASPVSVRPTGPATQHAPAGGGASRTPPRPPAPGPPSASPPVNPITSYEAESSANTRPGTQLRACPGCSGGTVVGFVGNNTGTLQFNGIAAPRAGRAMIAISYVNGDQSRSAELTVNGSPTANLNFPGSGGWTTVRTLTVTVTLRAGTNTIRFANSRSWAPDFDRVTVFVSTR